MYNTDNMTSISEMFNLNWKSPPEEKKEITKL